MKITKIEYEDKEYKWKFKPINLYSTLTLLVGISGVGKTQILKSIYNLKKIANGASLNGVKWNIKFSDEKQQEYCWTGEFETKNKGSILSLIANDEEDDEKDNFSLVNEKLSIGDNIVFERQYNKILFEGKETPKLSPHISVIDLLSEEEKISAVQQAFDRIILSNQEHESNGVNFIPPKLLKRFKDSDFSKIQQSSIPLDIKLILTYRYHKNIFDKIKNDFIAIFPFVEDIRMQPIDENDFSELSIPIDSLLKELRLIAIKERSVDYWIEQPNISAGMLKSLMYIAEIYLLPQGSVVLIDEFENSLGINCIDSITDNLLSSNELQFIITSHHPYIINNINPQNWKVVTRKAGIVETIDASKIGISNSRDRAFLELNNYLQEYDEEM